MGRVLEGEPSNHGVMSANALPLFHGLSGCDTTSSIFAKSKKTFYDFFQKLQKCLYNLHLCSIKEKDTKKINDPVNLNTNFYFVLCFLTVNKTFMGRSIENF